MTAEAPRTDSTNILTAVPFARCRCCTCNGSGLEADNTCRDCDGTGIDNHGA